MPFRDISDILIAEGTLYELYYSQGYDDTLSALRIAEAQISQRILQINDGWTKRRLQEVKKLIQDEINKAYGGLFASMQSESVASATITAGAIAGVTNYKIPTATVNDILSSNREIQLGMKDNKIPQMYGFKEMFDLREDEHARALKRVISAGVAQGLTAEQIVKNLGATNKQQIKQLKGSVYTVIADSRTKGNEEAFKELERLGVVSYYEHNSVLDSRTSIEICVPRDGRRYYKPLNEIGVQNIPPLHKNCRSKLLPKTKEQLNEQRPSQFSPVDANLKYKDWFKMQDEWYQRSVLGKKKFELYKKGQYSIQGLPDVVGKKMSLDTIKSNLDRYARGD